MRQNLTLLLFLCSLYGFAQLYVQEGTTLSLGSPQTVLSSQETLNKIDAPLRGKGTLFFNSTSAQQLTSSQVVLELPTLHIENADLIYIETVLNIYSQLEIDHGQLTLFYEVKLPDPLALVLGEDASIFPTTQGLLVYNTQFETSNPLVFLQAQTLLVSIETNTTQTPNFVVLDFMQTSNFGSIAHNGYKVYFKYSTPPPKKGLRA